MGWQTLEEETRVTKVAERRVRKRENRVEDTKGSVEAKGKELLWGGETTVEERRREGRDEESSEERRRGRRDKTGRGTKGRRSKDGEETEKEERQKRRTYEVGS